MKKTVVHILAAALLLSAGCMAKPLASPGITLEPTITGAPSPSGPASTPSPTASGSQDVLKALLPDKTGFQWQYFGFAEYAMTMQLKSLGQSGGALTYQCEGAVADMSDGEAKGDFSVRVIYKVLPGALTQELTGEKALDNVYPNLELIRAPLEKGAKWVQSVRDGKGREATLACSIDDVKDQDGRKVYFVTYRTEGSDYYEKREITEGIGVTAFDRVYEFENLNDLIGYRLYTPESREATAGWEQWLPQLGKEYTYFGLAEYGHRGALKTLSENDKGAVYEYRGVYNDGTGKDDRFVLKYFVDFTRGTVTEQAVSNERGKKEVNSKLHNLVILKFPLSAGSRWSHGAKIGGKAVTVRAEVVEYDEAKGIVKVRYTAKGASGYYKDTYIEDRTFEKGYGLTGFGCLLPGSIGISAADAKDPKKLEDALVQHMFGYSINKGS